MDDWFDLLCTNINENTKNLIIFKSQIMFDTDTLEFESMLECSGLLSTEDLIKRKKNLNKIFESINDTMEFATNIF